MALDLIGKALVRPLPEGLVRGRIVETEAYAGQQDPASHAYRKVTQRNQVMFGPAGYLYVYVSYGMHVCMNVVTDEDGIAGAVLIRAVEPLEGLSVMQERRGGRPVHELCNGPGKLCQAFGITLEQYGADLEGPALWLEDDGYQVHEVRRTSRVGISAGEQLPLRFLLPGNSYVSPGKPSASLPDDVIPILS